ncbi:DegT/DnrJ/EryC1/StrS family aminotransferase [Microvirga calopogonii]|uniref:DegT/DnrJ/EryC1/StrS family aminotransferase n=1 Tax=Microvirga calopogonii TaxID=2078013 RepID=UPI000E0D4487|nr:DegT/DnrJ/EryC1/StrS family aminotransferase [Microvirga calopogonii]
MSTFIGALSKIEAVEHGGVAEDNAAYSPPPMLVPVLPSLAVISPYLEQIDHCNIYSNNGPLNRAFCNELAKYIGGRISEPGSVVATTVSNGTAAIELALRARARQNSQFIMLPAYTFIATAHAVSNVGYKPLFIDVDPELLTVTPDIARAAISEKGEPAALVVVSPFGGPVDIRAWEIFEAETGIPIIFDLAAGITSIRSVSKQPICISLHATKTIGVGEGGAVISTDADLIARIQQIASFGFKADTRVSEIRGGNYRLSEYAAAIGLASLKTAPQKLSTLFEKARIYRRELHKVVGFQPGFGDEWVAMTMNVILHPDRVERTISALEQHRIPWRRWWSSGCHTHPAFAQAERATLTATDVVAYRTIALPFHVKMSDEQIARVSEIVRVSQEYPS